MWDHGRIMIGQTADAKTQRVEVRDASRITGVSPVLMVGDDCNRGGCGRSWRGWHGRDARDTGWPASSSFLVFLCVLCVLCGGNLFAAEPEVSERDLPRIPAVEPRDAVKTLKVRPGFSVELAASEPNVVSPVAMAFDENGRLLSWR